ncbi:hypothetical protein LB505_003634 [Fusarium chuoi]|nr:hypothetical protein LB505_003634 [Fusarium chuoi]
MFFLYNLERKVTLHPSFMGRNMHDLVTAKLLKDVEGTCAGSYFIISIMDAFEISEGRILPGLGMAEFTVGYRAVVWRPFKGETLRVVPDRVGTKKIEAPLKEGYKQLGDSTTAASPSITGCSGKSDSNENLSITTLGRRQIR